MYIRLYLFGFYVSISDMTTTMIQTLFKTMYSSPIGDMMLASDGKNIVGLWIVGQKYFAYGSDKNMMPRDDLPVFILARDWLNRYFAGNRPDISELPLAPQGSAFRQKVWKILCNIPYGHVCTYGDIARQITSSFGAPHMSARAVGGAVGHNPISIIIPCHRVVGAGGKITGYAAGVSAKIKLLKFEGADISAH